MNQNRTKDVLKNEKNKNNKNEMKNETNIKKANNNISQSGGWVKNSAVRGGGIKRVLGVSPSGEFNMSYKKSLRCIREAGFKYIMPLENGSNLERRLKLAQKMGLTVPYVHFAYRGKNNPCLLWTDKKCKEKQIKSIEKRLDICAKYGIDTIVMHSTRRVLQFKVPMKKEIGLESFKQIFAAAEKYKVKIALENLNVPENEYTDYLFENINSSMLGFCYDCGHHYLHDPKTDFLKKYGSRCIAVHLHDNMATKEKGDEWAGDLHLLPGDGKIDFARVIKDLSGSSYKGVLMLEIQKNGKSKYNSLSLSEFYREAYKRGENLIKMLDTAK